MKIVSAISFANLYKLKLIEFDCIYYFFFHNIILRTNLKEHVYYTFKVYYLKQILYK